MPMTVEECTCVDNGLGEEPDRAELHVQIEAF